MFLFDDVFSLEPEPCGALHEAGRNHAPQRPVNAAPEEEGATLGFPSRERGSGSEACFQGSALRSGRTGLTVNADVYPDLVATTSESDCRVSSGGILMNTPHRGQNKGNSCTTLLHRLGCQ